MELKEIAPEVFMLKAHVPLDIQTVNLYIFRGDVPTLIDAGTLHEEVYDQVRAGLNYLGINRLEQVIVTHWHVDHAGGAQNFAREGSRIFIGARDYGEWKDFVDQKTAKMFMDCAEKIWKVPTATAEKMMRIYSGLLKMTAWPEGVETLEDGQRIKAGNTVLRAVHTPGHTVGHLSFYDENERLLFSGDMLLPNQVPYPGIWQEGGQVVSGLPSYLRSLDLVEDLAAQAYYPAHGEPQTDAGERCRQVRAQILRQLEHFSSPENIYEGAMQLMKGKNGLGALFVHLHYVYGWETCKKRFNGQSA